MSQQKPSETSPKTSSAKKESGYRTSVRILLPPTILTRPDRSKKDMIISPQGIERNMIRQVGKMATGRG